jgi:hypothetical protein
VDRALPFDEADNLRYRVLRWDGDHHVHVDHQVSLLDPAFFCSAMALVCSAVTSSTLIRAY